MKIPFINLEPQLKMLSNADINFIQDFLPELELVGGASVDLFEKAIKSHLKVRQTFRTCANGTDAIELAIQTLTEEKNQLKIGCPNVTFWATFEAIVNTGNIPVLIDIHPRDYNLSLESLKEAHKIENLDGLILPHLFGWCSGDLLAIREYCVNENIFLIEDAAQAFGITFEEQSIFDTECSTTSFYPAKVLGGCMDGGGCFFRDSEKAEIFKARANHGRSSHYGYSHVGRNSRMSGIQARYLLKMLEKTNAIIDDRLQKLEYYKVKLLTEFSEDELEFYSPDRSIKSNGYLCKILLQNKDRNAVSDYLKGHGIASGQVYPSTMDQQKVCNKKLCPVELPVSTEFVSKVLDLPLFFGMSYADIDYVCKHLRGAINA